jgi:excisionase family DNA binding protein
MRETNTPPLTVVDAAARLGLSSHTIRAWIGQRRIAYIRLGRAIRIPAAEIERLLSENTVPAAPTRH